MSINEMACMESGGFYSNKNSAKQKDIYENYYQNLAEELMDQLKIFNDQLTNQQYYIEKLEQGLEKLGDQEPQRNIIMVDAACQTVESEVIAMREEQLIIKQLQLGFQGQKLLIERMA